MRVCVLVHTHEYEHVCDKASLGLDLMTSHPLFISAVFVSEDTSIWHRFSDFYHMGVTSWLFSINETFPKVTKEINEFALMFWKLWVQYIFFVQI